MNAFKYPKTEAFFRLEPGALGRFAEIEPTKRLDDSAEPSGFAEFFDHTRLSGDITEQETRLRRRWRLGRRRPF